MATTVEEQKSETTSRIKSSLKSFLSFVIPCFLIVGTIFAVAFLFGQFQKEMRTEEERRADEAAQAANRTAGSMSYIKDHRTGLCYAAYDTSSADRYQPPIFRAIGPVPCANVEKLLLNPNPPSSEKR